MTRSKRLGATPRAAPRNSHSNRTARRPWSLSTSSTMRSVMLMRSKTTSWSIFTLVRLRTFSNASSRPNTSTFANSAGPGAAASSTPRAKTSRPSVPRSASSAAAALYFWYSRRRRTSSARGSSSSSCGMPSSWPVGATGRSIFDLMCTSVAAITRYSLAISIDSTCMSLRYSRYFAVMKLTGMSRMSSSCCWMRWSSRSSGPSNDSSLMRYWPSNTDGSARGAGVSAGAAGVRG